MMTDMQSGNLGPADAEGFWIDDPDHCAWLAAQSDSQLEFFAASAGDAPGFSQLDHAGKPLGSDVQELHATTRLIHAYSLGHARGYQGADRIIDRGMAYLASHHKDPVHGGYFWALSGHGVQDDRKLTYGHVFVLLAASSAKIAGHPDADALLADIAEVLDQRFWEEGAGLFSDEWNRDWTPFSTYRGMNANMHGVEALLAAFEATGEALFLDRAGRILKFFVHQMAPQNGWRLPEHYTEHWQTDRSYAGNHMFRPAGTTPGHAFEFGRLALQHWDLSGRPANGAPQAARNLIERALADAWLPEGGLAYTLDFDGKVADGSRFWWPVTEAIGAMAALIVMDRDPADEIWYRRLWAFADAHFIDHARGGWYPAIDDHGQPTSSIFTGKPDIYHALQACLLPLAGRLSRLALAPGA
ncbi:Mannose or cellobiose epimerase, N-acyl-D-glucosamine 2-epimerase family [Yoonia rosea]|uniref:Mannose or cellobiose epimerase, N-acyl-D-glucosamine 2-epimerase family n=2 Tax=Yoonia rosea TaxID=287098 RepID=A0A1R3WB92_9RHOB|nr:Mannose or cellobiose epimerase, N-acyl-D-glucosamine 2-epimerase family [Yoonia rosea]